MKSFNQTSMVTLLAAGLLSSCGTVPEDLARPAQLSCMYLREPLSQTGKYGLMNFTWETRLERGPYISERLDAKGTYYRAPPGGIRTVSLDNPKVGTTRDGGIYIPKDPGGTPRIYEYLSGADVPVQIPAEGMDCSALGYTKDPQTSQIIVISVASNGAASGASNNLIGQATATSRANAPTYPPTVFENVVSQAIYNGLAGNIDWGWALQDPTFIEKIRELAASKVLIKEISPETKPQ